MDRRTEICAAEQMSRELGPEDSEDNHPAPEEIERRGPGNQDTDDRPARRGVRQVAKMRVDAQHAG